MMEDTQQLKQPLSVTDKKIINLTNPGQVSVSLVDTTAQTVANYSTFFVADRAISIISVQEIHGTAGNDAGAVTLQVEKLTGTTAKGSGTNLLLTAFNLKGTANMVQYGSLVITAAINLDKGDRLAVKSSGTLTTLKDVTVTVFYIYNG